MLIFPNPRIKENGMLHIIYLFAFFLTAMYFFDPSPVLGGDDKETAIALIKNTKAPLAKRLQALAKLGETRNPDAQVISAFIVALKDSEPKMRAGAVKALGASGPKGKAALPHLIPLLADEEIDEAANWKFIPRHQFGLPCVAYRISRMMPEALPALIEVLKDAKAKSLAHMNAARTLAEIGLKAKPALLVLEEKLKNKNLAIAVECACAYGSVGGEVAKALPILQEGLRDKSTSMLCRTTDAALRLGPKAKDTVPMLTLLLEHKDPKVQLAAAFALGGIGTHAKSAAPALGKLLRTETDDVYFRDFVAFALAGLGPDALGALPMLIERLEDVSSNGTIIRIIGMIGPQAKDAVPGLIKILKREKSDFLHEDTMLALGQIGPDAHAAVPALVDHLKKPVVKQFGPDGGSGYRERAPGLRALGQIGPKAAAALPTIKKLTEDNDPGVRAWAMYATAKVTRDAKPQVPRLIELWKKEFGGEFGGYRVNYVAEALEFLGPDARPARDFFIDGLLNDKYSKGIRHYVVKILGQLCEDSDVIVPKMIALTERKAGKEARRQYCLEGIEVLASLGPLAKAALPRIRRLAKDEDEEIASAAALALAKIEGK